MTRRSPLLTLAGMACAALALTACGSETLDTAGSSTSSASSAASSSSSSAASSETSSSSESSGASGGVDEALAAKVPDKIKSAGTIIVGSDASYAPNEYLGSDGKTVEGMDVDLFNAVAAKLGLKTEFQNAKFDSIILGVKSGKFDVGVSSFTINPDRMKEVNMVSYFNAGTQWAVAKGNPEGVNLDNLCGLTIGVQKGTVQVEDITARSKKCTDGGKDAIKVVQDDLQSNVTAGLVAGKTVAMLADSPITAYAVTQTQGKVELLGDVYDAAPYGFVVPKDQADFAQAIADALKAIEADGSYQKALETWGNTGGAISDFAVNPAG